MSHCFPNVYFTPSHTILIRSYTVNDFIKQNFFYLVRSYKAEFLSCQIRQKVNFYGVRYNHIL